MDGDRRAVGRREIFGADDRKFLAPDARRHRAGRLPAFVDDPPDFADADVTDRVAEPVVDGLEVVDVDCDQDCRAGAVELVRELVDELTAVWEPGQAVGSGKLRQSFILLPQEIARFDELPARRDG